MRFVACLMVASVLALAESDAWLDYAWLDFRQAVPLVSPGMPAQQVVALLGKPTTQVSLGDGRSVLKWMYLPPGNSSARGQAEVITCIFTAENKLERLVESTETDRRLTGAPSVLDSVGPRSVP